MTAPAPEITWKRQPNGHHVARHGFWVYTVFRTDMAPQGRQWILEAYPEGNPDARQQRTGLSNVKLAKAAVTGTRCHLCSRPRLFSELEPAETSTPSWGTLWVCRDREDCDAAAYQAHVEATALVQAVRDTDHDQIYIREDEHGPQLVFEKDGSATVVNVTEGDLDTLQVVLTGRSISNLHGLAAQRRAEAVARFSCPFCGAAKGEQCRRVEATYSPALPALTQPHTTRVRLLDGPERGFG